jgi:pseudouridine-5'-phosphate glycosidase
MKNKHLISSLYSSESQRQLQTRSGTLLAVPIPEKYAEQGLQLQKCVDQALEESAHAQLTGKALTPWLLNRVRELSGGRSLHSS